MDTKINTSVENIKGLARQVGLMATWDKATSKVTICDKGRPYELRYGPVSRVAAYHFLQGFTHKYVDDMGPVKMAYAKSKPYSAINEFGNSILTVLAPDAAEASSKIEEQLNRAGRAGYLRSWIEGGRKVRAK